MNKCYRIVWSHSRGQWMVASELARSKAPTKAAASDVRRTVPGFLAGLLPSAWLANREAGGTTVRSRMASSVAAAMLVLTGGLGAQTALAEWTVAGPGGTTSVTIGDGGEVTFAEGANIAVAVGGADDAGVVTVSLDSDVDLTSTGSLTVGSTVVNNSGVTATSVTGGNTTISNSGLTFSTGTVSVSSTGINAGGNVITGVADGTANGHAVNFQQLEGVRTTAEDAQDTAEDALDAANAGWNLAGGSTPVNIGPDGTVTFLGDSNVTVTQAGTDDAGTVGVALNPNLSVTSVNAGGTVINSGGLSFGSSTVSVSSAGINAGGNAISGVGAGVNPTDAVNKSQLDAVGANASAGWNVGANGETTGANVAPGAKVDFSNDDDNIVITRDGTNLTVDLADDIEVDSVTTGDTTIDTNGLTIDGGPSITKDGINAGGKKITLLASGDITEDSTDAVSGQQIYNYFIEEGASGVRYFRANSEEADSEAVGEESIAIGPKTVAEGESSLAAGDGASTTEEGVGAIALGQGATAGGGALNSGGAGAVAIGRDSHASGTSAVALGDDARATAGGATALGASAAASGGNSIAIGDAQAVSGNSFAAGAGAYAGSIGGVALGAGAGVGTNGTEAGDRDHHIAIGTGAGTNVAGNQTTAIGYQAGSDVSGLHNVAIGSHAGANLQGNYNVAIGHLANLDAGSVENATAIGAQSDAARDGAAVGYGAQAADHGVAVGSQSSAGEGGVALGRNAQAEGSHVALGIGSAARSSDAQGAGYLTGSDFTDGQVVSVGNSNPGGEQRTRRIVNVADGAQAYDAVNVGQLQKAQDSVATLVGGGVTRKADGTYSPITVDLVGGGTAEFNTVVEAIGAVTSGTVDILPVDAVRYNAEGGISNVAAGTAATDAVNVQQLNEVVAENGVKYFSVNSEIVGNRNNASASGMNAMAVGPAASARGHSSLAAGHLAHTVGTESVALGYEVEALGDNSTVVGSGSTAYHDGGVAIGQGAESHGENSIVMGTRAHSHSKTPNETVHNAIVIGTDAEATADNGIAVGQSALASELRAVAQGYDAHAVADDAMAFGSNSRASGVSSQASGTGANASGTSAQASGTGASASGTNAQASGTGAIGYATDGIAMGTGAVSGFSDPNNTDPTRNSNSIAIGNSALADHRNALALGMDAHAEAESASAIGDNAEAHAKSATAIGDSAVATEAAEDGLAVGSSARVTAQNASAFGKSAEATAVDALAVGSGAKALGLNASAVGRGAQASEENASAVGSGAQALAENASAFGQSARALHAGSVALGSGSETADVVRTPEKTIDGNTYEYAGATAGVTSTVSVGKAGAERTITNVAAGRVDASSTDAINGSQLYGTNMALEALADDLDTAGQSVAAALGGTSSYNPETHTVTAGLSVQGNNYTNVQDALTYVGQGWNVSAEGGATANVAPGGAVDFSSDDENIVVSRDGTNLVFDLNDELTIGESISFVDGDTFIDGDSITTTNLTVEGTTRLGDNFVVNNAGDVTYNGSEIATQADGLSFAGNTGGNINKILGDNTPLTIAGTLDAGDAATGENLRVDSNGTQLNLVMARDLTGLDSITIRNGGPVINNTGINMGGKQITNLADGTADDHAVNLGQLKDVEEVANAGWNVSAQNGEARKVAPGGEVNFSNSDGNIAISRTSNTTDLVFDLDDDIEVDSVTAGDTVVDNSGVTVGGDVHLGGTGLVIDGGPSVTVAGIDAGDEVITNVAAGVADTDAVNVSQLKDLADTPLTFAGDAGTDVDRKLGETVNLTGGATDTAALTDGNIGVVANGADTLEIKLNKDIDLGADGSVAIGDTELDNDGLSVNDGAGNVTTVAATGTTVTNGTETTTVGAGVVTVAGDTNTITIDGDAGTIGGLSNTTWDPEATYTGGLAATQEQLKDVSDAANAGWNVTVDGEAAVADNNVGPNGVVDFTSDDNIEIERTGTNLAFSLADDITVDSLALNGTNGADGLTIRGDQGAPGVAGTDGITRIVYEDDGGNTREVATMDDGLVFAGNTGDDIAKKLGETLTLSGELAAGDDATGANLRVDSVNGQLNLVMAQDLTDLNSITINNGGPVIDGDGIDMNDNQITNLAAGTADDHAVNLGQLNEVEEIASRGWNISADGDTPTNVAPGDTVDFGNTDENIEVTRTADGLSFDLAENIDLGEDGSVTTGNTVMNDSGVTVGAPDSNNPSTTIGAGVIEVAGSGATPNTVVIDGESGTIGGLTNKTWDPDNTPIVSGRAATEDQLQIVNNALGNLADTPITFGGDTGATDRLLGERLNIVGSNANLSTEVTDDETLEIALNDDLVLDSVTTGDTVMNNDGLQVGGHVSGNDPSTTVGAGIITVEGSGASPNTLVIDGESGTIAGLTNTTFDADETYTGGLAATQEQLSQVNNDLTTAGLNFVGDDGQVVHRDLGDTLSVNGGASGNIGVARNDDEDGLVVELADNIELSEDGSVAIGDGTDGSTLDAEGLAVVDGDNETTVGAGTLAVTDGANSTTINGNQVIVGAGGANPITISGDTGTIGGLTNRTWDPTNPVIVNGQAATEDQLLAVSNLANAGWNVSAQGANATNVGVNSETGNNVDLSNIDGNIVISKTDDSNDVTFDLNKDVDLTADGSLTTGNTVVNNAGLTVQDGADDYTTVEVGKVTVAANPTTGPANVITIDANTGTVGGLTNTTFDADATYTGGLAATQEQLSQINSDLTTAGLNFVGDDGNEVHRDLGETLSITGGADVAALSSGNIGVIQNDDEDGLIIELAKDVDLTDEGSLTIGDTVVDNDGLTVVDADGNETGVSATGTIVSDDAGNETVVAATGTTVTNDDGDTTTVGAGTIAVTDGTASTTISGNQVAVGGDNPITISGDSGTIEGLTNTDWDPEGTYEDGRAATEEQLKAVSDVAHLGWNVGANGEEDGANVAPGAKVDFSNDDENIVITRIGTDLVFNLADDLKIVNSVAVGGLGGTFINHDGVGVGDHVQLGNTGLTVDAASGSASTTVEAGNISVTGADGLTTAISGNEVVVGKDGDNPVTISGDTGTIAGLTNKTFDPDDFTSGQAATEDQLKQVSDVANAGWTLSDGDADNDVNIGPNGKATFTGDDNITVAQTGSDQNGEIQITLNKDIDLGSDGSLTIGNTVVDNDGVRVGDKVSLTEDGLFIDGGPSVTQDGIAMNDKKISGLADGVDDQDAVNVRQLTAGIEDAKAYTDDRIDEVNEAIELIEGDVDNLQNGADGMFQVSQEGSIIKPDPSGANSAAGGNGAVASGDNSLAVGNQSQATGDDSTALGNGAVASVDNSVALGAGSQTSEAVATPEGNIAGNTYQYAGGDPAGVVSVGSEGQERQVQHVAAGQVHADSTDAINGSQLYATNQQVGINAEHIEELDDRLTSTENAVSNIQGDVTNIRGDINNIRGDITTIKGDITNIEGDISELDQRVTVVEGDVEQMQGDITSLNQGAAGMFQVSQDYTAPAPAPTGIKSVAGGTNAVASGNQSMAIGNDSIASAEGSTVLGNGAVSSGYNSVVLGRDSTDDGQENVVSVGSRGNERRIVNVAAGVAPTDAVNVGQLQMLGSQMSLHVHRLDRRINKVQRDASAGIASVAALESAPYIPGKFTYAVSAAHHNGEEALGISVRRASDNGRWSLTGGFSESAAGSTVRVGFSGVID